MYFLTVFAAGLPIVERVPYSDYSVGNQCSYPVDRVSKGVNFGIERSL